MVFSNKAEAFGLERARRAGIPTACLSHKDFTSREGFDAAMVAAIKAFDVDVVVLAGFMRLLTPVFLGAFETIINIHPALLPCFAGCHGQADAADYGVKLSGCTVHFVNEIMDNGPVVIQAAVPVVPGENRRHPRSAHPRLRAPHLPPGPAMARRRPHFRGRPPRPHRPRRQAPGHPRHPWLRQSAAGERFLGGGPWSGVAGVAPTLFASGGQRE